jgi:PleD family two-component response regulator
VPVLTVLVIDDNELQQRVAYSCLERVGHRVMVAASASDALGLIGEAPPGMVLVSTSLPENELRAALASVLAPRRMMTGGGPTLPPPVVLLAAPPGPRPELPRGVAGVIARPYERDRLAAHVELYSMGATPARILVVDDSPTLRHSNVATLRTAGHETLEASDGQVALAVLDSDPGIDMVLSDVVMPHMDGYELVAAIRARPDKVGLPVVMLTTLDDVGSQSRAIEAGADDVLSKPIQPAELRARVRAILRLKTLQQRLLTQNHELSRAMDRRRRRGERTDQHLRAGERRRERGHPAEELHRDPARGRAA